MWTRIALYATLGYTLDALGHDFTTWGFWAVLGLFWASETLTRMELIDQLNEALQELRRKNNNKDSQ
jgi:hypothetical protein